MKNQEKKRQKKFRSTNRRGFDGRALEASIKSLEFQTDPQEIEKFGAGKIIVRPKMCPNLISSSVSLEQILRRSKLYEFRHKSRRSVESEKDFWGKRLRRWTFLTKVGLTAKRIRDFQLVRLSVVDKSCPSAPLRFRLRCKSLAIL